MLILFCPTDVPFKPPPLTNHNSPSQHLSQMVTTSHTLHWNLNRTLPPSPNISLSQSDFDNNNNIKSWQRGEGDTNLIWVKNS